MSATYSAVMYAAGTAVWLLEPAASAGLQNRYPDHTSLTRLRPPLKSRSVSLMHTQCGSARLQELQWWPLGHQGQQSADATLPPIHPDLTCRPTTLPHAHAQTLDKPCLPCTQGTVLYLSEHNTSLKRGLQCTEPHTPAHDPWKGLRHGCDQ